MEVTNSHTILLTSVTRMPNFEKRRDIGNKCIR
jgi:hypothetical protein